MSHILAIMIMPLKQIGHLKWLLPHQASQFIFGDIEVCGIDMNICSRMMNSLVLGNRISLILA